MSAINWEQHSYYPDVWCVFDRWGKCVAVVQPQSDADADGFWRGAINARSGVHEGLNIDHCPSLEQAKAVISRELRHYWPEVVGCGNGSGGPTTPKPRSIPKPQFPPPRKIREDFLP
jgi:hypothetical protein